VYSLRCDRWRWEEDSTGLHFQRCPSDSQIFFTARSLSDGTKICYKKPPQIPVTRDTDMLVPFPELKGNKSLLTCNVQGQATS
jgi:hypothetical protein